MTRHARPGPGWDRVLGAGTTAAVPADRLTSTVRCMRRSIKRRSRWAVAPRLPPPPAGSTVLAVGNLREVLEAALGGVGPSAPGETAPVTGRTVQVTQARDGDGYHWRFADIDGRELAAGHSPTRDSAVAVARATTLPQSAGRVTRL